MVKRPRRKNLGKKKSPTKRGRKSRGMFGSGWELVGKELLVGGYNWKGEVRGTDNGEGPRGGAWGID